MFQKTIRSIVFLVIGSLCINAQMIDKNYNALAKKFADYSMDGDYTNLMGLFAKDAIVDHEGIQFKGKMAINEFYQSRGNMGRYESMTITPDELIMINNDEALGRGTFAISIILNENKQKVKIKGRFLNGKFVG